LAQGLDSECAFTGALLLAEFISLIRIFLTRKD
jgi:hypothetical protein